MIFVLRRPSAQLLMTLVLLLTACVRPQIGGVRGIAADRLPDPAPSVSPRARGRPVGEVVRSWSSDLWRLLTVQADGLGLQVTNSLFNALSEFEILDLPIGNANFRLVSRREVYDNFDLLNTWTVIDRFSIESGVPVLNASVPIPLGPVPGNLSLGFSIGGRAGMNWTNIRQVAAQRYRELPTIEDEATRVRMSAWFHEQQSIHSRYRSRRSRDASLPGTPDPQVRHARPSPSPSPIPADPNVTRLDPSSPWYMFDPSIRPRLSQLLNRLTFPFKLPVSYEKFQKLEDGELISYSGTGSVELGGSVGWKFAEVPVLDQFDLRAGVRTYLRGDYAITVLKENSRYAKVKVSRSLTRGRAFDFNSGFKEKELFEGFLVLGKFRVLDYGFRIIPFSFTADRNRARWFDIGYRYDLEDPEGREAFERAVTGAFGLSDELCDKRSADGTPAVSRIFDRAADQTQRSQTVGFELGFLQQNGARRVRESLSAVLNLPDGTHRILKEATSTQRGWKNVFGIYERRKYNFTVALNREDYDSGDPGALFLIAEAFIEDSRTTGREMRRYISEIERVSGRTDIFPELPLMIPRRRQHGIFGSLRRNRSSDLESAQAAELNDPLSDAEEQNTDEAVELPSGEKVRMKRAMYGRSSFYYGLNINRTQIDKLIAVSTERKIQLLEKAFGLPAGAWSHGMEDVSEIEDPSEDDSPPAFVQRFFHRWERITPTVSPEEKVKALGELFSERRKGYEFMLLLQLVLAGEELDYFLTAQNPAFGRIQVRGKATTNVDRILYQADREMGFERMSGGFRGDPEAVMSDLHAKVLGDDRVELNFNLAQEAKYLYFRLTRSTRWKKYKVVSELVVANAQGRFKRGANRIILDRLSSDYLERELGAPLQKSEFYLMNMGYTRDGVRWGQATSTRFQMLPPGRD